ncbi:hypothetical protein T11_12328 [Trichinella zimbabwensis]|uniref:Uncharacterized protein n=1 Tax=Trichinella zimbabwensis TaxID=268475 RepID=A0A0V1HI24_9BILA|nr:hypothetical protein T11_12328 [Trichinella zimbabwensis]
MAMNCMLHSPLLSSWPEAWFVTELATFFNTKLCVIFGFLRLQRLCPVLSSESWIAIARILPLAIISFENANAPEFNSSTIAHSFNRLPRLRKTDKKISSRQHQNLSNLCSGRIQNSILCPLVLNFTPQKCFHKIKVLTMEN